MADVENAAANVELQTTDRTAGEYFQGVAGSVPGLSSAVSVGEQFGEFAITKFRADLGGENAPGVGQVAAEGAEVVLATADFVAEAGSEITSIIEDPLGWVVSAGMDMLLSVVTPLQDMLHYVTGDAPALEKGAENFNAIAEGLVAMSDNLVQVGDDRLKEWQGEASKAGKKALAQFAVGIDGVSAASVRVAEVVKNSAILMQSVEAVIKSLITDFVSYAIQVLAPALASAIISLGGSVAAAWGLITARFAQTFPRVMKYVQKVTEIIGMIGKFMGLVKELCGSLLFTGLSTFVSAKWGIPSPETLAGTSIDKGENAVRGGQAFSAIQLGTGLAQMGIDHATGGEGEGPDVDDAPGETETRERLDSFGSTQRHV